MKDAKIAIYSCPFDMLNTETKGTVLIKNAKELLEFSSGEENLMEEVVLISLTSVVFYGLSLLKLSNSVFYYLKTAIFSKVEF